MLTRPEQITLKSPALVPWSWNKIIKTQSLPEELIIVCMYIRINILAYCPTDTLNWQVLWGKEKYLLNSLHEKLRNKGFLQNKCKQ